MGEKPAWMEHWKEIMQLGLSLIVTLGFFWMMNKIMNVPAGEAPNQAAVLLFGALATNFGIIIGYFFGSSKGSSDKTALLKKGGAATLFLIACLAVSTVNAKQLESGLWWMPTADEIAVDWKAIKSQEDDYRANRDLARKQVSLGDLKSARAHWAQSRDLALFPMPRAYRSNDIGYSFIQEAGLVIHMTKDQLVNAKEHLEAAVADFKLEGPARHEKQRAAGLAKASKSLQSVKDRLAALAARKADG